MSTNIIGIFEDKQGEYYWMDWLDEQEVFEAKYFLYEYECYGYHRSVKSALYDDMTGYVDVVQDEENNLCNTELYVVTYFKYNESLGGLDQCVDFGITKWEIIENVKNQKYTEGATYYTMGHMFFATKMMMNED